MANDSLSVGGLVSGLDTNSIIDGLVRIEQRKVVQEATRKKDYELKLTSFDELSTKFSDFAKKSEALDSIKAFNLFSSASTDGEIAKISGDENASEGSYDLVVDSLATSLKVASNSYASQTTALGFTGIFTISTSDAAQEVDPLTLEVEVELAAGDTLKDIAAKINRAAGAGAKASVMKLAEGDYRLLLSGVDEGSRGFELKNFTGTPLTSLDLLTGDEALRSETGFKLSAGGAASSATTWSLLATGLGSSTAISNNDTITISGLNSAGNAVVAADYTISDATNGTLQGLLDEIKTRYDAAGGATHTVTMNSSGEILVKGDGVGSDDMTLTLAFNDVDTSGSSLAMDGGTGDTISDFKYVVSEGKNAFYQINGLVVSSQSNKDSDTVSGTTFELLKADPTESVKLTLTRDKTGIQAKIQDFIDSYNAVLKFLDEKSKVEFKDSSTDKDPDQKSQKIISKGPFAGDYSILGLRNQLQSMMTGVIEELEEKSDYSSLASLGITSSTRDGTLSIDSDKLEDALDSDFEGVRRLFITSGWSDNPLHSFGNSTKDTVTGTYAVVPSTTPPTINGLSATRTEDLIISDEGDSKGLAITAATGSGAGNMTFARGIAGKITEFHKSVSYFVDGFMTDTRKGIQTRIDNSSQKIFKLEDEVARFRQRLIAQFSNLEQSIARLQQQSAAFQGQISGLNRR